MSDWQAASSSRTSGLSWWMGQGRAERPHAHATAAVSPNRADDPTICDTVPTMLAGHLSKTRLRLFALPLVLAVLTGLAQASAARTPSRLPRFQSEIQPLPAPLKTGLKRHLWHRGCPTPLSQLRLLTVDYVGFDRNVHRGELVVNADAAVPLRSVFGRLYRLHFRIREMRPLDDTGDDTAAFECRDAASSPCPGTPPTHTWSEHAYGEAVDLNPIENPYTGCRRTRVKASIPYLNRSRRRPGMVNGRVIHAFASIGWGWGGSWSGTKDYMHFSATGH